MKHDTIILRIGLLATALILLSMGIDIYLTGRAAAYPHSLTIAMGMGIVSTITVMLATLATVPRTAQWLVLAGALMTLCGYGYLQFVNDSPLYWTHTDNEMIAEYAVEVLQSGQNPYTWDYSDMTRVYRDRGNRTTQFLDNATQHRVTYPIFPTLLLGALDAIGLGTVRIMSFVFQALLLVVMFLSAPVTYRPLVLLPLFILKDFQVMGLLGAQDVVWSALLVSMIVAWRYPWLRSILYALAANFRQQPWFVAPFLLILIWRQDTPRQQRIREIIQLVAVSAIMFLAFNLPFFLWNPEAWLLSALEPSYARFNIVSQGFAAFTHYDVLPLSRTFYSVLQLAVLLISLFVYWRHTRAVGQAYWLVPALFFWVYYRGLGNYWFYWIPPLIMATLLSQQFPSLKQTQTYSPRRTALLCTPIVAGVLLVGIVALLRPPALTAALLPDPQIIESVPPRINQMQVQVTNHSGERFIPRFSVQYERVTENYPWMIVSGAEWLEDGQSDVYTISAEGNGSKMIPITRGAQIVISDAGRDYHKRAVVAVVLPTDNTSTAATIQQTIQHPDQYYVNLGEMYLSQGKPTQAQQAFEQALVFNAANQAAQQALNHVD